MADTEIIIQPVHQQHRSLLMDLLSSEKLPVDDLPDPLENFFVAVAGTEVTGGIGLERYGNKGLLRSLVVHPAWRNKKIADQLILHLEQRARSLGIVELFLLTETVPQYFERKGFSFVLRDQVPGSLQKSSEFSHVCPQSALVMKKQLL